MGRRSRKNGISGATIRAARAALRERDDEAARISQGVYETTVAIKGLERIPLWAQGPLTYAAELAGGRVAAAYGFRPADAPELAAYILDGLLTVFESVVADFQREHFEEWRAERRKERESHGQVDAADDGRAGEGEPGPARPVGTQAPGEDGGDAAR